MIEHGAHYIGGQSQASNGSDTIAVVNAATQEVMGSIPAGNAQDADEAVRAAREAFGSWSTKSPAERAGYLKRTAPTGPEPLPGRTDHRQSAIRCSPWPPPRPRLSKRWPSPAIFNWTRLGALVRWCYVWLLRRT